MKVYTSMLNYSANNNATTEVNVSYTIGSANGNSLPYRQFANSHNLSAIRWLTNVVSLGESCFWECENLAMVTIPCTVSSIGKYCFSGCRNLRQVNLSEGLVLLGKYCFSECGMESIHLPSTVTDVKEGAFYLCECLYNVTGIRPECNFGVASFARCPLYDFDETSYNILHETDAFSESLTDSSEDDDLFVGLD
jgi:hypothetical protein